MSSERESLNMHIVASIVGAITGFLWWAACATLFDFEVQALWVAATGCVLSANLAAISVKG